MGIRPDDEQRQGVRQDCCADNWNRGAIEEREQHEKRNKRLIKNRGGRNIRTVDDPNPDRQKADIRKPAFFEPDAEEMIGCARENNRQAGSEAERHQRPEHILRIGDKNRSGKQEKGRDNQWVCVQQHTASGAERKTLSPPDEIPLPPFA